MSPGGFEGKCPGRAGPAKPFTAHHTLAGKARCVVPHEDCPLPLPCIVCVLQEALSPVFHPNGAPQSCERIHLSSQQQRPRSSALFTLQLGRQRHREGRHLAKVTQLSSASRVGSQAVAAEFALRVTQPRAGCSRLPGRTTQHWGKVRRLSCPGFRPLPTEKRGLHRAQYFLLTGWRD